MIARSCLRGRDPGRRSGASRQVAVRIASLALLLPFLLPFLLAPSQAGAARPPQRRGPALAPPPAAEASLPVPGGRVEARTGALRSRFGLRFAPASRAPESMAREFLRATAGDLRLSAGDSDLELRAVRAGLGTRHVRFRQTYRGLPVFGADVVVGVDEVRGLVTAVASEYEPGLTLGSITPRYTPASAARMALALLAPSDAPAYGPLVELGVHSREGIHRLAYRVAVVLADPRGDWELFVDAESGEVLAARDRMCYVHGSGLVFNPDPITTSGSPYGTAGLTDAGDADSPELLAERKRLPLYDITQVGDNFQLDGPITTIFDFPGGLGEPLGDSPAATQQADPDAFDYTRSEQGFEAVMVYGHITNLQYWIQRIGFVDVNNDNDPVDPHGLGGADNSFYSPTVDAMAFGEGGVDDAEDAEVIAHEYGHAIQHDQVPGWGAFIEGGAMGEGFGDYLGGSYGAWESAYLDDWFAKWDADGANTGLRRLVNGKTYPDSLAFEVHDDGEIWSACLWQIHGSLGRVLTDQIVIQSHFYLTPGATFRDGALAILQADQDITGGANQAFLEDVFAARGILQGLPITVAAGVSEEVQPAVGYERQPWSDLGRWLLNVWVDHAYGFPGQTDARLMHASGGFTTAEFFLGAMDDPDVGFAPSQTPPDTGFIVVGATPGPGQDIIGFKVDGDDGSVSASFDISGNAANDVRPSIAGAESQYLVAYVVDEGTGSPFIEGQRLDEDGNLVGAKISFASPQIQGDPDVGAGFDATVPEPQFLVAWWQYRPGSDPELDPTLNYIRAARVTAAGGVLDVPALDLAVDDPSARQFSTPAVAFDGESYLVVWREVDNLMGTAEIRGRLVDAATGALEAPFLIGPDPANRAPDVAFAGSQYLVVWETSPPDPAVRDVLGRRFTPDLSVMDPSPLPIAATGLLERSPRVTQVGGQDAASRGQSFWVAWSQTPVEPSNADIVGTFVPEGTITTFPAPSPLLLSVNVVPPPDAQDLPGSVVLLPFDIANGGARQDGYRLTVLETDPWPIASDREMLVLDSGASGTVVVAVTVPSTATAGQMNWITLVGRSATDSTVNSEGSVLVTVSGGATAVGTGGPPVFRLGGGNPNPFGGSTRIEFSVPRPSTVRLEVFDAAGQRVRTLRDALLPAGRHHAVWDGRDQRGARCAAGIYFARLSDGIRRAARKLVLMP
jgi:hypothetical protein